jgi:5-methylthioadenosine/S-adenosylhomocysteine deaminase
MAAADARGHGGGRLGLCRARHARGDRADGRRPQLLRGDPRSRRGVAAALRDKVAALRLPPGAATIAAIRDAFDGWSVDRDLVRPAVAPTIPHHCSDEFILGCAGLARDFDVGLHSHVAESKVQAVASLRVYGKTQTAHLDALGVLGPHFTVAHGVWLDEDDMARLGDHGASVAHNPGSNMRLGSGLADTRAMLERRVNLGIGTDGASCADNQNMYEAMRLASFVSKVQGPEWRRWLTTREAALAATEGSARALGFGDKIGRIAPGWKADLVLLDLDHPNWMPFNDPVNQLVHCEDGTAVDSVMIGGRLVVEGASRSASISAAARARRGRARTARRRQCRQPPSLRRRWSRWSAAIAPAWRGCPTTSTATAREPSSKGQIRRCRRPDATNARSAPTPPGLRSRSSSSPTARRSARPSPRY